MYKKILLAIMLGVCCITMSYAQHRKQLDTLRVAINNLPPYVFVDTTVSARESEITGIAIDILHQATTLPIQYVIYPSKEKALQAVDRGDVSMILNATISTERMKRCVFTNHYIRSEMGVLTQKISSPTLLQSMWKGITNGGFIGQVLILFIYIFVLCILLGTVVYFIEKQKDHIRIKPGFRGYIESIIFSFITLYSGYEDDINKKRTKLFMMFFIFFFSMVINPFAVGYYANMLSENSKTQKQILSIEDLREKNVYTIPHTWMETVLQEKAVPFESSTMDSIIPSVIDGSVVFVHDKYTLMHYIYTHKLKDQLDVSTLSTEDMYKAVAVKKEIYEKNPQMRRIVDDLSMKFQQLYEQGNVAITAAKYGVIIK